MNKTFLSLHRIAALRVATYRNEMVGVSSLTYPELSKVQFDANGQILCQDFQHNREFVLIYTITQTEIQ